MKKINLIEWLSRNSHEKQSPQRFARYAAILIMLLTLGVGQMWAKVVYYNDEGQSGTPRIHYWGGTSPAGTAWENDPNMVNISGNIYAFDIGDHKTVIFRYNNGNSQTGDLTVPTDGKNYISTKDGSSWSTLSTFAGDQVLYLLVNSNWKSDNAWFTACFLGVTGQKWVKCTRVGTTDYYSVTVPSGEWPYVIFCRMKSSDTSTKDWSNVWNQTNDLAPSSGNNGVEITGWSNSSNWIIVRTGISVSRTPTAAANAPTITNNQTVVKSGSSVTINAQTEKTGYHWVNWTKTNGTLGNANNKSTTFTPSANSASAVANYALNQQKVKFYGRGNTGGSMSDQTYTYGVAQNLTSNAFTKTGYTFGGWATSEENAAAGTVAHANGASITLNPATHLPATYDLYAIWTPNTYDVTLNPDEGSSTKTVVATYGAAMPSKYKNSETSVAAPTFSGYDFQGYYDDHAGAGTQYYNSSATSARTWNKASTATLYAKWTQTVELNKNTNAAGATSGSAGVIYKKSGKTSFTAASRTGYTCTGYYTAASSGYKVIAADGTMQSTNANISSYIGESDKWVHSGATTLYAYWTAKSYTVTLKPNGATTGSDQIVSATYDASMPGTTTSSTAVTAPSKTGYAFTGFWDNSTNGSGTKYYNANLTSARNWDKATASYLWAQWSANSYTVMLSASGETGYGGSAGTTSVSATYDSGMPSIASGRPTAAPGYKFMGYFLGQNGTGVQYYDENGTGLINWTTASNTTLYAYFRKTEISSLTHPSSIANGAEITLDVNPVFNQTGAEDNMDICWSLLYDNDNPVESGVVVAANPEGGKPKQVRFTLTGLSAGNYQVQAILKAKGSDFTDVCDPDEDDVEELCTIKSNVRIAGNSKVTIQYKDGSGNTLAESRTIEIASGESAGVKAPSMIGYTFSSWTVDPVLTNTCENSASCGTDKDTINISAAYDGFLTANYTKKDMIYFNNTLGWEHVYVYFYDNGDYWDHESNKGIGAQYNYEINSHAPHYYHFWGEMTQIGTSNVYYFDYQAAAAAINPSNAYKINSYTHVAFTKDAQGYTDASHIGYGYFYSTEAAYRTDFAHDKSMYVPLNANTVNKNVDGDNKTVYYNTGYWMNYPENTGYTLKIYDNNSDGALKKEIAFTFPAYKKMPMSITTDLEAGKTYGFKIERVDGTSYGNAGTMSNGHSGDGVQTVWEFKSNVSNRCGLTTSSAGDYTFTLSYGLDAVTPTPGYNYLVGVHYPEATGDYRVLYKDDVYTKWKPSSVIPKNLDKDTISYFVRKAKNPVLKLQKCTATYEGGVTTVTWSDTIDNLIPTLPTAITEDGVYYFCINKNEETGTRELGDTKPYEGNFYIRVDGAGYSNWDNFRASDHLMPYSDYSFSQKKDPYSHYYTKWYDCSGGTKNIKFVVANDYSVCVSDTLDREALSGQWTHIDDYIDEIGNLNRSANVRFMYNYKTNAVSRAFIDGAYADGGNFLKILAKTTDGIYLVPSGEAGDPQTEITFHDNGNWVYEVTVYAVPGARYKLRSLFGEVGGGKNQITQWFKGGAGLTAADSATIIGGTGSSRMQIRLLYDFKTNRVVTAYQPSGTIDEDLAIHADIMFMREHQGDVEQITFASGKKITDIENIYCGLRFNKWTLNNRKKDGDNGYLDDLLSRYERDIFYVSFPYDVKLSDVIGFGTYGQHWIVEYYDGAARAKNGFWIDSESYWKFVTPAMKDTFTLKAGTGYIVALDLDELYCFKSGGDVVQASLWAHTAEVELLFPGKVTSISNVDVTYKMPEHTCTINRGTTAGNRTKKDSHWNVLGIPTFKNITGAASGDPDTGVGSGELVFANTAWVKDSMNLKFIYDGNLADNSLTAKAVKGFEFKAMHAYVVQYCGDVTFTTSATPAPSPIVARRTYAEKPIDVDFRLELNKNGVMEDQTFVSLSNDENVSADFEFGEDLSKEFNTNRANIYTFIGTEWVAGNTLPMSNQTTIIPVGVKTAVEGEYTFSIPEGTYGVGITLIDNVAGARVNLGLMDYTVTLGQGQIDDRFVLEISPIQQTPTNVEAVGDQQSAVRKVMIDGLLYIVKDGKVFDARGNRVK